MFTWSRSGGDWRIGYGESNFLIAEGAGWSLAFGESLFAKLQSGEIDFAGLNKRPSGLEDD